MKKHLTLFAILFGISLLALAQDNHPPKLSPSTQQYLLKQQLAGGKLAPQPAYVYKQTPSGTYISALVKVSATGVDQGDLERMGAHTGTKAGNVWTVQIPLDKVLDFTQTKGFDYIQLDEPVNLNLDSVRKATHVDSVTQGINLPMPYTGKDVVLGIVDVGFDFTHPTFYDTTGTLYRIKRVWEEKTVGTPPAGFAYGNELTDSTSIIATGTENEVNTHGTHVAGIAGGSGFGSTNNSKFRGMAFDADIVMVGIMPDSLQWQNTGVSDIIDGINYVFTYAQSVGKPAIVNLSWGTVVGPHDGSSLFSQALDALTGPGKIFACSAGNDGDTKIHLGKDFTTADTTVSTCVGFDQYLGTKNTWLDLWGDSGKTFSAEVALYNDSLVATTGFIGLDNTTHRLALIGTNNDTCFVTMTTSTAEFNGKPRIYLSLDSRVPDSVYLTIKATSGTVNVWNGYIRDGGGYFGEMTKGNQPWAVDGDSLLTATDFVSSHSAISVGAFATRNTFRNIQNHNYSLTTYAHIGGLVPFSSLGPTADGRIKPDITAPGLLVMSSVSSFDTSFVLHGSNYYTVVSSVFDSATGRTHYYAELSGTSMSCPVTSGIIALMLQANPALGPEDVRTILAQTAIQDTFTGVLPEDGLNTWGHGKINAYEAVLMATTYTPPSTGIANYNNTLGCQLYPNPSKGQFILSYTSSIEQPLVVEVYNLQGKRLYMANWNVTTGNNLKPVDVSILANGIYLTRVTSLYGQSVIKTVIAQ